jgi:ribose transport system substrate-binding protein
MPKKFKVGGALAAAVLTASALAACGSGNGAAASSQSSTGSSSTSSSGSSASAGTSSVVSAAKAELAKYAQSPSFVAPGAAFDASKLKGKLIVVVAHDEIANYLVTLYGGIQAAAQSVGLKTQLINANAVPSAMEQGVLEGIHEHAAAIILDGIDGKLVTPQLQQAATAKIPVVDAPLVPEQNLFASIDPNVGLMGKLMADEAIVATNGHVHAAVLTFNSPIVGPELAEFQSTVSRCSGCSVVTTQDVEPTSWPTQVAPTTVNMIRANPNINVVVPGADSMLPFVISGVHNAAATGKVKIISGDGEPFAVQDISRDSGTVLADPGGSVPWIGWLSVDDAMRAALGMQPGNEVLPLRSIDASTGLGSAAPTWASLYGTAYQTAFKNLWSGK